MYWKKLTQGPEYIVVQVYPDFFILMYWGKNSPKALSILWSRSIQIPSSRVRIKWVVKDLRFLESRFGIFGYLDIWNIWNIYIFGYLEYLDIWDIWNDWNIGYLKFLDSRYLD